MKVRHMLLIVIGTGLAMAAVVIAANRAKDRVRELTAESPRSPFEGAQLPPGVRVPRFALRDQDGRRIATADLRGPAVVTFLYTHCRDTCPIAAQQIKGALDDLGRTVPVVAISVDPWNDTARSARAFSRRVGMTGRLRWALGSPRELKPVWRGFAIREQRPDEEHQSRIVLVDRSGAQRVGFPVSQATPERLAHDLRALGAG